MNLAGGGGEQVFAADDVGDALLVIVDDNGELVGPELVGAAEDEVADGGSEIFTLGAEAAIVPEDGAIGHTHALTARDAARRKAMATGAGVEFAIAQFTAGAGAAINGIAQAYEGGGVGCVALALVEHGAVPMQTVSFEATEDAIGGAGYGARPVNIFYADEPFAAGAAGIEIAGDGGDETAEVEVTGGGGREASAVNGANLHCALLSLAILEIQLCWLGCQTAVPSLRA